MRVINTTPTRLLYKTGIALNRHGKPSHIMTIDFERLLNITDEEILKGDKIGPVGLKRVNEIRKQLIETLELWRK